MALHQEALVNVGLAQLVERTTFNRVVAGSIPAFDILEQKADGVTMRRVGDIGSCVESVDVYAILWFCIVFAETNRCEKRPPEKGGELFYRFISCDRSQAHFR